MAAREGDERAAHKRSGEECDLTRDAADRVTGLQNVGRDKLGDDRRQGWMQEGRRRTEDRRGAVKMPEPQCPRRRERGDRGDRETAGEVAREDHPATWKSVRDRAAEKDEYERRDAEHRTPDPKLERAAAEREDLEWQRHTMDEVPEDRDRLTRLEQTEIAMAKGLQDERRSVPH